MRSAQLRRRKFPILAVAVPVGLLAAVFGVLWMLGVVNAAAFGYNKKFDTTGMVALPVGTVRIPAYTKITRDHLLNSAQSLSVFYLPKKQVTPEMITDVGQIVGRVLNHDKPPNYIFTEADFMPPGTRPGIVAGIPAGKRAVRVDASKVQGLVDLLPGDRFDLVATIPIEAKGAASQPLKAEGVYAQQLALQSQLSNWQKQATVRVLVQNGAIVQGMVNRQVPVSTSTLTQGLVTRNKVVQEIVIAVDPEDVARLTEALAVNADISCVPRSGRPDDPENSVTPDLQPWSPFSGLLSSAALPDSGPAAATSASPSSLTAIESIAGSKREMVAAPRQR